MLRHNIMCVVAMCHMVIHEYEIHVSRLVERSVVLGTKLLQEPLAP